MKANSASGSLPAVRRRYCPCSSAEMSSGPNNSSGTLNSVSSQEKKRRPPSPAARSRTSDDLAVPGGPMSTAWRRAITAATSGSMVSDRST